MVYSVDAGTWETTVPDDIKVGVEDVTADAGAENPVAEVAFR